MTTFTARAPGLKWHRIGSWTLRIILAVMFAGAGLFKLSGTPAVIDEFDHVGFGQELRFLTATLELAGASLLLWPRTIAIGALVLMVVCGGAFVALLTRLHGDVVHAIVLAAVFTAIAWTHRAQLTLFRS